VGGSPLGDPPRLRPRDHPIYPCPMVKTFPCACAVLMCLAASGAATAQSALASSQLTARDYFNELRDANAFNHYGDEYACFPDEDKGGFVIVAKTKDIEKMMAANAKPGEKRESLGGTGLIVQSYFKGVANQQLLYEPVSKNSDAEWSLEFKSPLHGKMVYAFNWTTGRYRLQVYALDHSKTAPAEELSGKCELIHPWSPPPPSDK
jgi:hypothetical protein